MTPAIRATRDSNRTCALTPNVADIAQQLLRNCPYIALRYIKCHFHDGVLILTGKVPTYHTKQIAQTVVRNLDQVEVIDNRLDVSE